MFKKFLLFLFVVFTLHNSFSQTGGVTIGADRTPHKSAVLDLEATNKGFLPPRLTTVQRKAISSPAAGLIVFDTDTRQLFLFDGEEWLPLTVSKPKTKGEEAAVNTAAGQSDTKQRPLSSALSRSVPAGCLPSLLPNIVYTRADSTATAFDTSGNIVLYAPNAIRSLSDVSTGKDLGYAVEDKDSTLLYQSDNLLDVGSYFNTKWNGDMMTGTLDGTLAGRPRFLLTKTDNQSYKNYRKLGLKMLYNTPYLLGVLVQKGTCSSFRVVMHSDGANTDAGITVDLTNGTVAVNFADAGTFSNARAVPLKNAQGAYLFIFTFTPKSQGATANTTHQFRMIPNSSVVGDNLYVASPFIIQTNKVWATNIVSNTTTTLRNKESLKVDLGLQTNGTVLVKGILNDRVTKRNRAISWQSSTGTSLSLTGGGYSGGYATAENGTLVESAGTFGVANVLQPGAKGYYIDPSVNGNKGSGTAADPFKSFSQLPTLSGNLNGTQIFIKRGTTIKEQLTLTGCSNFIVDSYGSGALPVLDGSDVVKSGWTAEGSVYYLKSQTTAQSLFINGNRLIGVKTKAELSANANTSWFDAANSRIYINIGSLDPSTQLIEMTVRSYAMRITGCTNFNVRNLQFQRGRNSGLSIDGQVVQTSKGSLVERCIATYNGAFDATAGLAGDGIVWYGTNKASKGVSNIVRQCVSTYNVNVGYEFCFQDSLTLEDCFATRNGQGIELWGHVTNSNIRRNKIYNTIPLGVSWGHGNGLWMPNSSVEAPNTGGHNNNKIYANVFATSWQETLDIEAGSSEFSNNIFLDPTRSREDFNGRFMVVSKFAGADSVKVNFRNNIFYQPPFQGYPVSAFTIENSVSSATLDYNYYYSDPSIGGYTPFNYLGTGYGGNFSAYKAGSLQDANSASQVNPNFTAVTGKTVTDFYQTFFNGSTRTNLVITDEAATDFRLTANSPCIAKGDSTATGSVGLDFVPFGTSKAIGPYSRLTNNPISLGDIWMGNYSFRGGSLYDIQASSTTLTDNAAVIQLSLCP